MKTIIQLTFAMVLLLPLTASAATGPQQAFSADLFYRAADRNERRIMRVYVSEDKIRMEHVRSAKGIGIGIVRYDRNVVWSLNHRTRVYSQYPLGPLLRIHPMELDGSTLKRLKLGQERLKGVDCNKVRVRYLDGQSGRPLKATAWFARQLGTYVRIENADGSEFDLRNIRFGAQPGHLFEIPRRYRLRPAPAGLEHGDRPVSARVAYGPPPPWFGRSPLHRHSVPPSGRTGVPVLADGRLFDNSDFEDGTLHNWSAQGNAFRFQPTKGDNPTARRNRVGSDHQGNYWIGTYEKYGGRPGERPGQVQGDRPTGTLTSVSFLITHSRIEFLVGGGNHNSDTYVGLLVNGKLVRKDSGGRSANMYPRVWHVGQYVGKKARIVIVDKTSRPWGHINADDFRYTGKALTDVRIAPSRPRPRPAQRVAH